MTGWEPIALEAAIKSLAGLFAKTAWDLGNKRLDEPIKQAVFRASRQYIQNYRERHGSLKVLGMTKPVSLESVYTTVQMLEAEAIRSFETIEALEEVYRQGANRSFYRSDRRKREGIQVANQAQYLTVLGGPGVGKSTFLRKMGLEALKGKQGTFQHRCIPVFLELKQFDSDDINIEHLIIEEFRTGGFPDPEQFTARALKQGRLLVLLDGLDEAPSQNLDRVIRTIQDFADRHSKNRFIASCRTAAYHNYFRRFTDVAIAEFDDAQIRQFIHNWFRSDLDQQMGTAQQCWELLQKPENAAAKELAQTPLLLTFLCLVYDRSQNLPDNRSTLYRKALDILLEEWAAEKRIRREAIYQGLHADLEKVLLSEIAHQGFEADQLFFSQQDILKHIAAFLADTLDAPKHLDSKAVLNAIEVQQGILVERAEDVYSFSHLTLQEYLTAQYISDQQQIEDLVTQHLTDARWREVFLLVAGLMGGGSYKLLQQMEQTAKTYPNTQKLRSLLHWTDQVTAGSEGNAKPAAKRAVAICLARALARSCSRDLDLDLDLARSRSLDLARALNLNGYAVDLAVDLALASAHARARTHTNDLVRDSARANTLDNALDSALDSALTLEKTNIFQGINFTVLITRLNALKAQIPSNDQPLDIHRALAEQLQQTWFNALQLNSDQVSLSKAEVKALINYLEANQLMVQCKKAAVRVSRQTWEEIEARMLLVQNWDAIEQRNKKRESPQPPRTQLAR